MNVMIATLDLVLIIVLGSTAILGTIIFFFAGLHKVKKGYGMVVEKYSEYDRTLTAGIYYLSPLKYRRVGYYNLAVQERSVLIENVKRISIKYQIIDCQKLHYSNLTLQDLVNKIKSENEEITLEILTTEFEKVGLKFISVR